MLLLGLLPLMLLRGCGCQAADVPEDVTAEFSVRLYHQLQITGGEENIIFSPLSVALALGMVELGARGSSLEEIRQAALSTDEEQYVVRLANSLFLQTGVHFNEDFLQLMKKYFKAEVETSNCSALVSSISLTKQRKRKTDEGEFSDGTTEAGGVYQVLEMLYEGEDMSMMIILPRQEVPLASLEPIIKAQLLEEWANNVKRQKVEQKIDLRDTLQQLGIKNIFTKDADLSAMTAEMTDGQDLFIGKAVQKAYLEVTEEGAEGAAGSGMIALTRTLVLYPQVMADHPFFFVIRNRKTGSGALLPWRLRRTGGECICSSGVNTSSESFPKSHSHYSELSDTQTPFSVELTPDSGIVATPLPSSRFRFASWHWLEEHDVRGDQLACPRVLNLSYQDLGDPYQLENFIRILRRLIRVERLQLVDNALRDLSSVRLPRCKILNLHRNNLTSIRQLPKVPEIQHLCLSENSISSLGELSLLRSTPLRSLTLKRNPCQFLEDYRSR
ncbi:Neuroserpin [Labeo rohita]|uniref:Neuroserpin n=1 Tax=Labeo rohita TaxID=84645 RepID=A0ABQ8LUN8_LABRO|nr:Neuroserpin [Labeo rohita]